MAQAWEHRLRRAAKKQGFVLNKRTPCGGCWALWKDGHRLHHALSPNEVAERLHVDLSDWNFGSERGVNGKEQLA